jgi:hypothetical protein
VAASLIRFAYFVESSAVWVVDAVSAMTIAAVKVRINVNLRNIKPSRGGFSKLATTVLYR